MPLHHTHHLGATPTHRMPHALHPSPAALQGTQQRLRARSTCPAAAAGRQGSAPVSYAPHGQHIAQIAATVCVSLSLLVQPCAAEELSIAFPASGNPEIQAAQKTMVESWAYVDTLYVDPPEHMAWAKSLQEALGKSFKASSGAEVTQLTRDLLAQLDDPYTRLLQDDEQGALAAEEEGKIVATGLGLQQLNLPASPAAAAAAAAASGSSTAAGAGQGPGQLLVVSFVVDNSPADSAGVKEGDVVLTVAGQPVGGKELRDIYKLLAKEADVTLARQPPLPFGADASTSSSSTGTSISTSASTATSSSSSSGSDVLSGVTDAAASGVFSASAGDAGAADGLLQGVEVYTVHLKPQPLDFEPAQYGIINLNTTSNNSSSSSSGADGSTAALATASSTDDATGSSSSGGGSSSRVGYLKILTFSSTAPQAVAEALVDMLKEAQQQQQQQGSGGLAGLIIDLRDNPGGIVEAGVDIAQDFLHAGQVLCIAIDKSGQEERVVLPEAHTLTELPLVVLVNHSTASTSELIAGTLHDELHAPLIGTTTYGKGRSQRVVRLADGHSTLLVSTLRYLTPQHAAIDNVGLQPDVVCRPEEVLGQQWVGGRVGQEAGSLLDDPCIKLAAERLAGAVV